MGCKQKVSDADCKIEFMGIMKFYRCPQAIIREASAVQRHDARQAFLTFDYRASQDYRSVPAWMLHAWNLIAQQRNAVDNYLQKKSIEDAKNKTGGKS